MSRARRDRDERCAGGQSAADAHACIEREYALVIGQQRVQVELSELSELGQIGLHLRERNERVANGIELGGG